METVERLCNQLARNKLLAPDAVRAMHKRWKIEAQDGAGDLDRFGKWLVANGFITDFQFDLLQRNFADLLYLNDYKLLERIGQGRMAGVYKAVHKFGQIVAVKVLPPSKATHPNTLARFQREARMAMRLQHPNVVRTYQIGKTKGGLHFLVMECLDGDTLHDVLQRRGRLPVLEALQVVSQALRGLEHIDMEGLVHRDLKPSNLMLVPGETAAPPVVKIVDIGLGRALFDEGTPGEEMDALTNEGALLGTPNYMAPEQARNAHTADVRADIYSLGCVLYHCLTGQVPFPDASVVRQIVRHATETPKPLRDFLPDAPQVLQDVIDLFLAKDPAQRYPTPVAAAKTLEELMDCTAIPPVSTAEVPLPTYLNWLEQAPSTADGEPAPPDRSCGAGRSGAASEHSSPAGRSGAASEHSSPAGRRGGGPTRRGETPGAFTNHPARPDRREHWRRGDAIAQPRLVGYRVEGLVLIET